MNGKGRRVRWLLTALGAVYVSAGAVFLSTGNAGGISLGLLFLGGAASLYVGVQLLHELQQIRQLLAQRAAVDSYQAVRARTDKPP